MRDEDRCINTLGGVWHKDKKCEKNEGGGGTKCCNSKWEPDVPASSPMDEPHTQTTWFETDYKKNHINEIEGINNYSKNNYSKVLLPSGECRWMDCSMMNGCPYPPCGE